MNDQEKKACIDKISQLEQEKKALLEKLASVEHTKKTVRRNFQDMAYLLTSLMSLSNRYLGGHVRRVGVLLRLFSEHLNLGNDTAYLYYYSALFHDIGLVGTKEEIILKPETELDEEERKEFTKHPVIGEKIIQSMYNLKRVALIIRSHHEEYSGGGYPDGLYGDGIPVGSRFLRIVNDYDNMMFKESMNRRQALLAIEDRSGIVYDPKIAETYCDFMRTTLTESPEETQIVQIRELKPGMILNENLFLSNGMMLVPKGMLLTSDMIERMPSFTSLLDMYQNVQVL